jgi:hypothetical protein
VVDSGTVRGIASVPQVHEVPPEQRMQRRVSELMRPLTDDLVVGLDDLVFDALGKATRNQVGRLAVLKDSRLVGYLSLKDITHVSALRGLMAPGPRTAPSPARAAQTGLSRANSLRRSPHAQNENRVHHRTRVSLPRAEVAPVKESEACTRHPTVMKTPSVLGRRASRSAP